MKFAVRTIIPTEAGNKMIKDPNFIAIIENYVKANNVEASYFLEINGDRTAVFIMDISSVDKIPAIAEPLFAMGAKVEIHPVMTFEDLRKGVAAVKSQG